LYCFFPAGKLERMDEPDGMNRMDELDDES